MMRRPLLFPLWIISFVFTRNMKETESKTEEKRNREFQSCFKIKKQRLRDRHKTERQISWVILVLSCPENPMKNAHLSTTSLVFFFFVISIKNKIK